jgi:hypothetical protein
MTREGRMEVAWPVGRPKVFQLSSDEVDKPCPRLKENSGQFVDKLSNFSPHIF